MSAGLLSTGAPARAAATVGAIKEIKLSERPTDAGAPFVLLRGGAVQKAPNTGTRLEAGDLIATSAAAIVTISLKDGSLILVGPGSRFRIDTVTTEGQRVLGKMTLDFGAVHALVSKVTPPHTKLLEIASGNARISVTGTRFILESVRAETAASQSTTLSTLEGAVALASTADPLNPVRVEAGFMSSAVAKEKLTAPLKIARAALADRFEGAFPTLGRAFVDTGETDSPVAEAAGPTVVPLATVVDLRKGPDGVLVSRSKQGGAETVDLGLGHAPAPAVEAPAAPSAHRPVSCGELDAAVDSIESTGTLKVPPTINARTSRREPNAIIGINKDYKSDQIEAFIFDPDVDVPTRARLLSEFHCFGNWRRQHEFYRKVVRDNTCALLRHRAVGLLEHDVCSTDTVAVLVAEYAKTPFAATKQLIVRLLGPNPERRQAQPCSKQDGEGKPDYGLTDIADVCEEAAHYWTKTAPSDGDVRRAGTPAAVSFEK